MDERTRGEGLRFLLDFWKQKYLEEYIPNGGSKIKFLTGKDGSGKTYALHQIMQDARECGYLAVMFSAGDISLADFAQIYREIAAKADISQCLDKYADEILRSLGKNPELIPEGRTAIDYYTSTGEMSIILRSEIRDAITTSVLKNPNIDHTFAQVCALLLSCRLGLFSVDQDSNQLMLGWLNGNKEVKSSSLTPYGIIASKITKQNARHMLKSLAEIVRGAGYKGLLVCIDDLDTIATKLKDNGKAAYTKKNRDDSYESIRQLIDDIDMMHSIMFIFALDKSLIENEKTGMKSYQALWMRIQNEIESERFNCFADIADLDSLARQEYSDDYLLEMSMNFAIQSADVSPQADVINPDDLKELKQQAYNGTVGLPELIRTATMSGGIHHE